MAEKVRYSLIVWEAMQVLRDAHAPLAKADVVAEVERRIQP